MERSVRLEDKSGSGCDTEKWRLDNQKVPEHERFRHPVIVGFQIYMEAI